MRWVKVGEYIQNIFYKILTELIKYSKSWYPKETTIATTKVLLQWILWRSINIFIKQIKSIRQQSKYSGKTLNDLRVMISGKAWCPGPENKQYSVNSLSYYLKDQIFQTCPFHIIYLDIVISFISVFALYFFFLKCPGYIKLHTQSCCHPYYIFCSPLHTGPFEHNRNKEGKKETDLWHWSSFFS